MLRALTLIVMFFASACAVLSPVAIFHWLCATTKLYFAKPFVSFFAPVFEPFNQAIATLLHLPSFQYEGTAITLNQPVLAMVLTAMFFLFSFLVSILKTTEEKIAATQSFLQRQMQIRSQNASKAQKQKIIIHDYELYVYIKYAFESDNKVFQLTQRYNEFGGEKLSLQEHYLLLKFPNVTQGVDYCLMLSNKTLAYYRLLDTVSPPQPFYISIHAGPKKSEIIEQHQHCHKVVGYAGANQILFTQAVKQLLEASQAIDNYKFQSQGWYETRIGQPEEVFRLSFKAV